MITFGISVEQFKQISKAVFEGIGTANAEEKPLWVCSLATLLTGMTAEEMLALTYRDIIADDFFTVPTMCNGMSSEYRYIPIPVSVHEYIMVKKTLLSEVFPEEMTTVLPAFDLSGIPGGSRLTPTEVNSFQNTATECILGEEKFLSLKQSLSPDLNCINANPFTNLCRKMLKLWFETSRMGQAYYPAYLLGRWTELHEDQLSSMQKKDQLADLGNCLEMYNLYLHSR